LELEYFESSLSGLLLTLNIFVLIFICFQIFVAHSDFVKIMENCTAQQMILYLIKIPFSLFFVKLVLSSPVFSFHLQTFPEFYYYQSLTIRIASSI
jgi:hypothetical protein